MSSYKPPEGSLGAIHERDWEAMGKAGRARANIRGLALMAMVVSLLSVFVGFMFEGLFWYTTLNQHMITGGIVVFFVSVFIRAGVKQP